MNPQRQAREVTVKGSRLYTEYLDQRRRAKDARSQAFVNLAAAEKEQWENYHNWKDRVRARVTDTHRLGFLTAIGQMEHQQRALADIAPVIAKRRQEIEEWKVEETAAIERNYPLLTFVGWLQEQAVSGNAEARAYLQEQEIRHQRAASELAAATDEQQARAVVYVALNPIARKNGQLVYRTRDGGQVMDEGRQVHIEGVTSHAIFLALSLLMEKANGQPITFGGNEAVLRRVVEMAAAKKMSLTFADPALERRRRELMGLSVEPSAPSSPAKQSWLARLRRRLAGT